MGQINRMLRSQSWCRWLFGLKRKSMMWPCKLSQSRPSSRWVPREIWGKNTGRVGWLAPNHTLDSRPKASNQEIRVCATQTIGQHANFYFLSFRSQWSFLLLFFFWRGVLPSLTLVVPTLFLAKIKKIRNGLSRNEEKSAKIGNVQ